MKSYLSLIPISSKMRRRQNRMTILCIMISVFLVTVIFSVTDMFLRTESSQLREEHGNWHIQLKNVPRKLAKEIGSRPDVEAVGWSGSFNSDAELPYYIGDKKAALYGADHTYLTRLANAVEEGQAPRNDREAMLTSNAKTALDVQIGDSVTIQTPAGKARFTVSGFGSDDRKYYQDQTYLVAVYLTQSSFASLLEMNHISPDPSCYVQFKKASAASAAIRDIRRQYDLPEEDISENTAVMGPAGASGKESINTLYTTAGILFALVLLAGILMISGSMNSSVAQRTEFFGMLRCVGASRRQIIHYVRLEALNWCRTAVPAGLLPGAAVSCGICALLHYGIGGEFASMPVFSLSPAGLISGTAVGIATVLLAAQSPAKRAAKVSPAAAVSGNADAAHPARHFSSPDLGRVERTLGIRHAVASRKNWLLMTTSFSLCIILFLCFSVGLDFGHELIPSLRPWLADLALQGYANERIVDSRLCDIIRSIPGVSRVYGSSYMEGIPAVSSRKGVDHVNLTSYSSSLLDLSKDNVSQGDLSEIYGHSNKAMTVISKDNPLRVGDIVQIAGKEVEIVCAVSDGLFPGDYSVICSPETFEGLVGEKDYSLIGIKLGKDANDETISQISALAEDDVIFSDLREENRQDRATYLAILLVAYSFLAILAMITLFNIVNSISMSVTARFRQYGAMRAVGMDGGQLTAMVTAEAFTYAVSGLVIGGCAGIALHRFLYAILLTRYFGKLWSPPVAMLVIIAAADLIFALIAVCAPSRRIRSMEITEAIREL